MNLEKTPLAGLVIVTPKVFGDHRGYFKELWNEKQFSSLGLPNQFVQDNLSRSKKGILRGLHFQWPQPQGKLVGVLEGEVYDVAVDIRLHSPTFGQSFGLILSAENHKQLYIPPGFAHGFQVVSETALFHYKCTEFYAPEHEKTLLWNDPKLDIHWPLPQPLLSEKDIKGIRLADFESSQLPSELNS